jgi:hypothetical protein
MAFNLILNSSNVVGSNANTYNYNFIGGNFEVKEDSEICVAQATIPYSWYNIATTQTITVTWPSGPTTFTWTIPAGFYTVADLNLLLQTFCITNNLYLINGSGVYVYYLALYTNATYYKVQLIAQVVPTSLPSGYSAPSGFAGYPNFATTPQITLSSSSSTFNSIIGFATGTFPTATSANISVLSTLVPVGSAVNSLLMSCNLCNNPVAMPSDIIAGIPITSSFGANINYQPSYQQWVKIRPGRYSTLTIRLLDQSLNPLSALDSNVLIVLNIRKMSLE